MSARILGEEIGLMITRGWAHGLRYTSEYKTWVNIRQRCYNPNDKKYAYYGGRGITVCERWRQSFLNFLNDMRFKPTPKHSIDRIDNRGNYCPKNCRWAAEEQQIKNRSKNYLKKTLDILTFWGYTEARRKQTMNISLEEGFLNCSQHGDYPEEAFMCPECYLDERDLDRAIDADQEAQNEE